MCGIALILSVVPVNRPDVNGDSPPHPSHDHKSAFSVDDLNANLLRRGPDCLGEKNVLINLAYPNHLEKDDELSDSSMKSGSSLSGSETSIFVSDIDYNNKLESANSFANKENNAVTFPFAFSQYSTSKWRDYALELHFIGATLHLRGFSPVLQPLVDASGNFLLYNGEIFGGIDVDIDKNDGEALLHALQTCSSFDCHCQGKYRDCTFKQELHVPYILSTVRGPWALIYWQARSKTLWFGRDAIGRRSLLIHWPTFDKPQFVLSSVSPSSRMNNSGSATDNSLEMARNNDNLNLTSDIYDWDELPCGIYSMYLGNLKYNIQGSKQSLVGNVKKHDWTDPLLKKLTHWERKHVDSECKLRYSEKTVMATQGLSSCQSDTLPYKVSDKDIDFLAFTEDSSVNGVSSYSKEKLLLGAGEKLLASKVLIALQKSVMRRTISSTIFQNAEKIESVPIAILFSGGLDSMLLAALLDRCLYSSCTIDLLNVSFDGASAPDRVSARTGLKELQRISPSRRWQLVEIDAELSNLMSEMKHLMSLIYPSNTYMDLNIGIALWLAARGEGVVHEKMSNYPVPDSCRSIYKSNARILLVGSGADEQCAGYGRHRTKFKAGGWTALEEEMKLDMQRIWKRNLGRDDRCISDHGKEARFPFLDEDVIETLLDIPLKDIANLNEPVGKGDKKILREVAKLLGLEGAAVLPKRAIQFGSRIARESNRKNFGSNRAANQASAGSVVIGKK